MSRQKTNLASPPADLTFPFDSKKKLGRKEVVEFIARAVYAPDSKDAKRKIRSRLSYQRKKSPPPQDLNSLEFWAWAMYEWAPLASVPGIPRRVADAYVDGRFAPRIGRSYPKITDVDDCNSRLLACLTRNYELEDANRVLGGEISALKTKLAESEALAEAQANRWKSRNRAGPGRGHRGK